MGNIITRTLKNGRVAHYAQYVELDGRRTSKATKAKTPEAAQKWLERAETRVAGGLPGDPRPRRDDTPPKPKTLTVRELAETFVGKANGFTTGHGADAANPEKYRRAMWSVLDTHVLPHLGALIIDAVRRTDVKAMKRALVDAKKSNRIVQKALRATSKLFNWAIDDAEIIDRDNPAARAGAPACSSSKSYYTEDEVARLLAWAAEHDPALHPVIAFAYYTACRKGEIAALRWCDVDLQGGRVVVGRSWERNARKAGDSVSPNLHPHLVAILSALREQTGGEGDALVFPDPETGGMRPAHNNRAVLKQEGYRTGLWGLDLAIVGAKVRRFRNPLHAFRHTTGTTLAAIGAPEKDIQNALGQRTSAAAQSYIHTAAANAKKYVDQMPAIGPIHPVISLSEARAKRMHTGGIPTKKRADAKVGTTQES